MLHDCLYFACCLFPVVYTHLKDSNDLKDAPGADWKVML